MAGLTDKIQSLRQNLSQDYVKPEETELIGYEAALWEGVTNEPLEYLRVERNLTDETIKHFRLGYCATRNAICIPVFKRGELINLRYRHLSKDSSQKYSQTKDAEIWIFNDEGLTYAQKKGTVLIVEGEFDLMSCWQAGSKNVISPASGKDSYGIWIEMLDNVPKVFIAYDNDKGGKETAQKMAERLGVEKCFEVLYPHDIKDANEYYKSYTKEDYARMVEVARPFYSYQFKGLTDIVADLRKGEASYIELKALPEVKLKEDWLVIISGKSNVGKTSFVMNMATELTEKNVPVLVLPFERGPQVVGTRYLQVKYDHAEGEFALLDSDEWDKIMRDSIKTPLYFAMPGKDETIELIKKSKRIFDTKVVIIDHLDYMIRNTQNKESEIGNTLQELKRIAEEYKILMIIVTHIRKIQTAGSARSKKPNIEDLKGSASLYQDPECVAMLTSDTPGLLNVDIVKNKGKMASRMYKFSLDTGKLHANSDVRELSQEDEDLWESTGNTQKTA
jgi:5S rRNA maturation endonuclease (ribonuclease M5)